MTEKFHRVRVTVQTEYLIPDHICANRSGGVNEVIEDWFTTHNINDYHASRDVSKVGNSSVLIKAEKIGEL